MYMWVMVDGWWWLCIVGARLDSYQSCKCRHIKMQKKNNLKYNWYLHSSSRFWKSAQTSHIVLMLCESTKSRGYNYRFYFLRSVCFAVPPPPPPAFAVVAKWNLFGGLLFDLFSRSCNSIYIAHSMPLTLMHTTRTSQTLHPRVHLNSNKFL